MSKRFRIVVFALAVLLANSSYSIADEEKIPLRPAVLEPVTLNQAVKTSLDNNTQIRNSILDVEISQTKVTSAKTRIFPEVHFNAAGVQLLAPLSFEFNKGVFGNYKEIGPIPSEKISVTTDQRPIFFTNTSVIQPISQIARIKLALKQLELSRTIAGQKLRQQRQLVASQVRRAYYKILETEGTFKVLESTRDLFLEIERITRNFLADKMVLPADMIEVKQQLANSEYEFLKAKNTLANQKEELSRLLGRDIQSEFQLAAMAEIHPVDVDLQTAQTRARTQRAELSQLTFQSQQIDLERRIRKLQQLPELSLIVDYLSIFGAQILPRNVVFAGLTLNWEPTDAYRKRFEIAEQRKLTQQINNTAKDMQTQIMMEVNSTHRNLQECKQFVQVTQLGRELAIEKLRTVSNKYKEKAALLRDVLQAQKDLNLADSRAGQASLALWTARADFEKAIGED